MTNNFRITFVSLSHSLHQTSKRHFKSPNNSYAQKEGPGQYNFINAFINWIAFPNKNFLITEKNKSALHVQYHSVRFQIYSVTPFPFMQHYLCLTLYYSVKQICHFHYLHRWSCKDCNMSFDDIYDLVRHQEAEHNICEPEVLLEEEAQAPSERCPSQGMYEYK